MPTKKAIKKKIKKTKPFIPTNLPAPKGDLRTTLTISIYDNGHSFEIKPTPLGVSPVQVIATLEICKLNYAKDKINSD